MRRFAVILVFACRAKASDGPPCGTVGGRFFTLASGDLANATVDPATRRAVADRLPAMRDALGQACTDGAWSAAVRACMVDAPDHVALQACEQQLTDDQRRGLDHAARGDSAAR